MTTERWLKDEVERWVERNAPTAPWLEDRVIESLRRNSRRAHKRADSNWSSPLVAGLAFLLGIAFVATFMVGAQKFNTARPIGPSRDPTVVSYRTLIDDDMHAVDTADARSDCRTRARCVESMTTTRDATLNLLADLSAVRSPESLRSQSLQLQAAGTQFAAQLNTAIQSMTDPSSDYIAASGLPDITALDLAASRIDCWPLHPLLGDHGIGCSPSSSLGDVSRND